VLRRATPNDVNKIVELEKSYYDGYCISKNILIEWIKTGRFYVIEDGSDIAGSIYFEFLSEIKDLPWEHGPVDEESNYVYISEVAVKSEDVLSELLSKVLEVAREHNVKAVLWLTGERAKHDKIEQRFISSNGFELKQRVKKWECAPNHFLSDHNIWIKPLV
jgi:N-acetylglutamate synthase-like GNAT family acetyltransferase